MNRAKLKIIVSCILLAIFSLSLALPAFAAVVTIGTSTDTDGWGVSYPFQRKLFYMADRLWAFYADGTNLVYRTSIDGGVNWGAATTWRAGGNHGVSFSMNFDGTYLHYAFNSATPGDDLLYRRATPETDGTLTWSAAEQTVYAIPADWNSMYCNIIADSAGYPWIGFCLKKTDWPTTGASAIVTKSSTNDGTWTTAGGFPATLVAASTDCLPIPLGVALTGGKTFWAYSPDAAPGTDVVHGNLWTGAAWNGDEVCSTHNCASSSICACPDGDGDDVHLFYLSLDSKGYYRKRTYGVGWGTEVEIADPIGSTPSLTLIAANSVIAFWSNANHIYYRKMLDGVWYDTVDWIDESVDTLPTIYTPNVMVSLANGITGILYVAKAGSPYDVRFNSLSIVAPTVTTQAVSDIEATTATGNGNITSVGGGNCTRRGFCYKVGTSGDPTTSDSTAYNNGDFGVGAYNKSITGLSAGTNYRVRAYAVNPIGTGYGSTVQFATASGIPAAPTNVAATDGTHTNKVVVTWTKSTGATGYKVYEGSNLLDTIGDVNTYDDTAAPAGSISNAGVAAASDNISPDYITVSLAAEATTNGAARTYKVVAFNAVGDSPDSATDTGYRGVGAITYQWQKSAGDSDADYSNVTGGTTDPYNDTSAPYDESGRYYQCEVSALGASDTPQTSTSDRGYRAYAGAGTYLVIYIDGLEKGSVACAGAPNSTANWTVGDDDATPYIGEFSIEVDGLNKCNIVWEYDSIFYDTSDFDNDATPTFRTTSSDADVSAYISEQTSLVTTASPSPTSLGGWTMITEVPDEPAGIYDEGGTSFPWGTEIKKMADAMRLPKEVFLFPLAFGTAILLGCVAFGLTHRQKMGIKGSLLIMCSVIEGTLIIWYVIGGGVIPGWVLIPFGIVAVLLLLWKNPYNPTS